MASFIDLPTQGPTIFGGHFCTATRLLGGGLSLRSVITCNIQPCAFTLGRQLFHLQSTRLFSQAGRPDSILLLILVREGAQTEKQSDHGCGRTYVLHDPLFRCDVGQCPLDS
ncbi:MAG: hypothetical protein K0S28_370 [Paucimonas sp.]|nr:hypothetical protein [Paucimonas sp.]